MQSQSYKDAADELRSLADGRDQERAPAGWLEAPGEALRQPLVTSHNAYFGHLPNVSWQMLAPGV